MFDIRVVNVTTTDMQLKWQNTDSAPGYLYLVRVQSEHSVHEMNSSHEAITLGGLIPGTLYNITIIPEVNHVQGNASATAQYTRKHVRTPSRGLLLDSTWRVGGERWGNDGAGGPCVSGLQVECEAV